MALHAVLHIAQAEHPLTSDDLAEAMATHPVVLRRTLAGLREAGIVASEKGHGGGWSLARPLAKVSVADVHVALGKTTLFAVGPRTAAPRCGLERAVNRAVEDALAGAEDVFLARLAEVSLAALAAEVGPMRHAKSGAHEPRRTRCSTSP